MLWHDVEQNGAEWAELRTGRLTGSNLATIMAHYGKGFGDPAMRLAKNIAYERMTGQSMSGLNPFEVREVLQVNL